MVAAFAEVVVSSVCWLEEKSIIACLCVGLYIWVEAGLGVCWSGWKLGVALVVVINNSPESRWCVALGSSPWSFVLRWTRAPLIVKLLRRPLV